MADETTTTIIHDAAGHLFLPGKRCEYSRIIVSLSRNGNEWLTPLGWRREVKSVALGADNMPDGLRIDIPSAHNRELVDGDVLELVCTEIGVRGRATVGDPASAVLSPPPATPAASVVELDAAAPKPEPGKLVPGKPASKDTEPTTPPRIPVKPPASTTAPTIAPKSNPEPIATPRPSVAEPYKAAPKAAPSITPLKAATAKAATPEAKTPTPTKPRPSNPVADIPPLKMRGQSSAKADVRSATLTDAAARRPADISAPASSKARMAMIAVPALAVAIGLGLWATNGADPADDTIRVADNAPVVTTDTPSPAEPSEPADTPAVDAVPAETPISDPVPAIPESDVPESDVPESAEPQPAEDRDEIAETELEEPAAEEINTEETVVEAPVVDETPEPAQPETSQEGNAEAEDADESTSEGAETVIARMTSSEPARDLAQSRALSRKDILDLQDDLKVMGYYFGTPTGELDADTTSALSQFKLIFDIPESAPTNRALLGRAEREREAFVASRPAPAAIAPAPVAPAPITPAPVPTPVAPVPEPAPSAATPPSATPPAAAPPAAAPPAAAPQVTAPSASADQPVLISRDSPVYPDRAAFKKSIPDAVTVSVSFTIQTDGTVSDAEVVDISYGGKLYAKAFRREAVRVIESQTFEPLDASVPATVVQITFRK